MKESSGPKPDLPTWRRPRCPICDRDMLLARVMQADTGGSIRVFFDCVSCDRLWWWEISEAAGSTPGELKAWL